MAKKTTKKKSSVAKEDFSEIFVPPANEDLTFEMESSTLSSIMTTFDESGVKSFVLASDGEKLYFCGAAEGDTNMISLVFDKRTNSRPTSFYLDVDKFKKIVSTLGNVVKFSESGKSLSMVSQIEKGKISFKMAQDAISGENSISKLFPKGSLNFERLKTFSRAQIPNANIYNANTATFGSVLMVASKLDFLSSLCFISKQDGINIQVISTSKTTEGNIGVPFDCTDFKVDHVAFLPKKSLKAISIIDGAFKIEIDAKSAIRVTQLREIGKYKDKVDICVAMGVIIPSEEDEQIEADIEEYEKEMEQVSTSGAPQVKEFTEDNAEKEEEEEEFTDSEDEEDESGTNDI
jgi:hypothetical protein